MYREHKSSLIERRRGVDCRDAIGVRRRSHRRARETAARHTVELSMNTPTGTPADPRTDQGSNADTTTSEVVVAAAGTAVAVTEGKRAAACRAGSGLVSAWNSYSGNRRHHDGPVGRRLNPPEKDPS